jgi:hypothetical protein
MGRRIIEIEILQVCHTLGFSLFVCASFMFECSSQGLCLLSLDSKGVSMVTESSKLEFVLNLLFFCMF